MNFHIKDFEKIKEHLVDCYLVDGVKGMKELFNTVAGEDFTVISVEGIEVIYDEFKMINLTDEIHLLNRGHRVAIIKDYPFLVQLLNLKNDSGVIMLRCIIGGIMESGMGAIGFRLVMQGKNLLCVKDLLEEMIDSDKNEIKNKKEDNTYSGFMGILEILNKS
ncbi:MAG: hypothetical protein ACRC68_13295 [Clostridium sp.]